MTSVTIEMFDEESHENVSSGPVKAPEESVVSEAIEKTLGTPLIETEKEHSKKKKKTKDIYKMIYGKSNKGRVASKVNCDTVTPNIITKRDFNKGRLMKSEGFR